MVTIKVVDGPTSPPSRGMGDRIAKVVDASAGAEMIVLFSLAMVHTRDKRCLKANFKTQ